MITQWISSSFLSTMKHILPWPQAKVFDKLLTTAWNPSNSIGLPKFLANQKVNIRTCMFSARVPLCTYLSPCLWIHGATLLTLLSSSSDDSRSFVAARKKKIREENVTDINLSINCRTKYNCMRRVTSSAG